MKKLLDIISVIFTVLLCLLFVGLSGFCVISFIITFFINYTAFSTIAVIVIFASIAIVVFTMLTDRGIDVIYDWICKRRK